MIMNKYVGRFVNYDVTDLIKLLSFEPVNESNSDSMQLAHHMFTNRETSHRCAI